MTESFAVSDPAYLLSHEDCPNLLSSNCLINYAHIHISQSDSLRDRPWLLDLLRRIPDIMVDSRRCPPPPASGQKSGRPLPEVYFHIPHADPRNADPSHRFNAGSGEGSMAAAETAPEALVEDECLVLLRYLT